MSVTVEAQLQVDDAGVSRPLTTDDFHRSDPAAGPGALEATQAQIAQSVDDLLTSLGLGVDVTDRPNRQLGHVTVDSMPEVTIDTSGLALDTTLQAIEARLPATLAGDGGLKAHIQNLPSTQPVSGTVDVGNWPATQPISAASLPLPAGAATDSTLSAIGALLATPTGLPVDIQDASIAVTVGEVEVKNDAGPPLSVSSSTLALDSTLQAVRDRLPASLNGDGGLPTHVANFPSTYDVSDRTARLLGHVTVDTPGGGLPVDIQDASIAVTVGEVEVKNDTGSPLAVASTTLALDATLQAVRDRLPTALNGDGGLPTHVNNFPSTYDVSDRTARLLGHVTVDTPGGGLPVDIQDTTVAVTQSGAWTVAATQSGAWTADTELPAAAALTDTDASPTVPGVGAYGMGWTGSVWRRLKSDSNGFLSIAPSVGVPVDANSLGGIGFASPGYVYNGTNWDRAREATGDALAATGIPTAGNMIYNGSTWDRLKGFNSTVFVMTNLFDGTTNQILQTQSNVGDATGATKFGPAGIMLYNGSTWDRWRGAAGSTGTAKVSQTPATAGGLSTYRKLATADTNTAAIKASAGQVYGWSITNTSASAKFVKLYNKATAPTLASDTPVLTLAIPAGGHVSAMPDSGIAFATGIAIAITGAVGDADTTALTANDVVLNLLYA